MYYLTVKQSTKFGACLWNPGSTPGGNSQILERVSFTHALFYTKTTSGSNCTQNLSFTQSWT
jgi:hypothetical protein